MFFTIFIVVFYLMQVTQALLHEIFMLNIEHLIQFFLKPCVQSRYESAYILSINVTILRCAEKKPGEKNSIRDARTPQPWEIFSTP